MDLTKAVVLCFKDALCKGMSPVSANSVLAAVNSFFEFLKVPQFCVNLFEAVKLGRAKVSCKGKYRVIFIPEKLRKILFDYIEKENITDGSLFVTRNGKPADRSNIWRDMKKLRDAAHVSPKRCFPVIFVTCLQGLFTPLKKIM